MKAIAYDDIRGILNRGRRDVASSPLARLIHPSQYKFIFRQMSFHWYPDYKYRKVIERMPFRKMNQVARERIMRRQLGEAAPAWRLMQALINGFYRMVPNQTWFEHSFSGPTRNDENLVAYLYDAAQQSRFEKSWRTSTVLSLLRNMRETEDFSLKVLLADALQDADCNDELLLNHLREGSMTLGSWLFKAAGLQGIPEKPKVYVDTENADGQVHIESEASEASL